MKHYIFFLALFAVCTFTVNESAAAKVVNGDITFTRYDRKFDRPSVFSIHPDGSKLQRLIIGGYGSEWSSDGSQLLYADYEACDLAIKTMALPGIRCLVSLPYGQVLQGCSFSPDHKHIACVLSDVKERKNGYLFYRSSIVRVSPEHPQQITTLVAKKTAVFYDPVWSGDSERIFFESAPNSKAVKHGKLTFFGSVKLYGIFSVNVNTPAPLRRLQRVPWVEPTSSSPAWSLDRKQFAYVYNIPPLTRIKRRAEIHLVTLEPTFQRRKLKVNINTAYQLGFSPDGQYLVFTGEVPGRRKKGNELFIAKTDGSELRRITNSYEYEVEPAWQPVTVADPE